jgi:hypothetical protein
MARKKELINGEEERAIKIPFDDFSGGGMILIKQPLKLTEQRILNFLLLKAEEQNYPEWISYTIEDYLGYRPLFFKLAVEKDELLSLHDFGMRFLLTEIAQFRRNDGNDSKETVFKSFKKGALIYGKYYVKCRPEVVKIIKENIEKYDLQNAHF